MQGRCNQKGISSVVVLLLTFAASLLVFTVLQDSVTQERMSGNFQKRLNAEYQADRASYDSFHRLNDALWRNPAATDADLLAAANRQQTDAGGGRWLTSSGTAIAADKISVSALGQRYADSRYSNQALLRKHLAAAPALASPFTHGITGCDGVLLNGSGLIDSYDSADGAYSRHGAGSNATVRTLRSSADINLTGNAPIYGDVLSTNNIVLSGSSVISGTVHSNGAITLSGGSEIAGGILAGAEYKQTNGRVLANIHANGNVSITQGLVGGHIHTRGDYFHRGLTVPGEVRANGNVILDQGEVRAGIRSGGNISLTSWSTNMFSAGVHATGSINLITSVNSPISADDLRYGGTATVPNIVAHYRTAPYYRTPAPYISSVEAVPPVPIENTSVPPEDAAYVSCDPLNIAKHTANLALQAADMPPLTLTTLPEVYALTPLQGQFITLGSGRTQLTLTPQNLAFLNRQQAVYSLESLNIGGNFNVSGGNVTLFVAGDVVLSGNSRLTIAEGSSLTLVVQGKFSVGASAKVITPVSGVGADGVPVFSVYSDYSGADGIELSGASDLYAAIYAPLTDVKVRGSGQLFGSVLAKTVAATGAGGIHYDEALGRAKVGNGNTGSSPVRRISFVGWTAPDA